MIAKCPNCNFIRLRRQRKTCPHCRARLGRPTVAELQDLGDHAMERARAARCLVESTNSEPDRRKLALAAFMSFFYGRHLTNYQAGQMLGLNT